MIRHRFRRVFAVALATDLLNKPSRILSTLMQVGTITSILPNINGRPVEVVHLLRALDASHLYFHSTYLGN